MNSPMNKVLLKSVVYFLITIAISWSAVYLIYGSDAIPATKENQESVGMIILLGPTLSGLLLTLLFYKRNGIRQLLKRLASVKHPLKWYLFAILLGPISTLIVIFLSTFFIDNVSPNFLAVENLNSALLLGLIGGLFVGLFEEIGWTGFAIHTMLKKYSVFITGLLIGIVWGIWHLILFLEKDSFASTDGFTLLILRLVAWLPAYRILMVWMYTKTGSLFLNVIMHLFLVVSLAIIDPVLNNADLTIFIMIRSLVLWVLVVLVLKFGYQNNVYNNN